VFESIIAMKRKRKRWKALLLTLDLTLIKNSKENRYGKSPELTALAYDSALATLPSFLLSIVQYDPRLGLTFLN
jgi:hypothetical protein